MNKYREINIIPKLMILLIMLVFFSGRELHATKQVLIINSYDPGFPTFQQYSKGLNEVFGSEDVNITMSFMDSKTLFCEENVINFKQRIKFIISRLKKIDLIITIDDNALKFLVDNKEEMFKDIPVIFWGINNIEFGKIKREGITGIVEDVSMRDNVELMLKLFPKTENIYAISDITFTSEQDLQKYLTLKSEFPEVNLEVLSLIKLSYKQLSKRLNQLGANDLVLLLSVYNDSVGKKKKFEEGLQYLKENVNSPVFHLWEHGIGKGLFGGKVISHYKSAKLTASLGMEILNGRDINSIPVIDPDSFKSYIFDSKQMKKFGIKKSQLPQGSIVINRTLNLWETNWKMVLLVLIIIALQTILIATLILIQRYRKKTIKIVSAQKEKYQLLAENTEDVIWTMAPNNEFNYVSPSVERLRGFTVEEVMKQPLHEFLPPESMQIVVGSLEKFWQDYNKELRPTNPWFLELEQYCANGTTVWTDVVINPVYDKNNEIQYFLGITRNLTERKRYEDLLKYNENLLRRIVNNIPKSFVAVLDKDLSISFVSGKEYHKNADKSNSQVSVINLAENQEKEIFGLRNVMIKEKYQLTFAGTDLTFELAYGKKIYIYRTVKLPDEHGLINKILVLVEDITARKQSDAELLEYHTKLEEMVETRTAELSSKNEELARFNQIFVGREFRIKELRNKLKEYQGKYGVKSEDIED